MNDHLVISAAGMVDRDGLRGTGDGGRRRATWRDLGVDPVAGRIEWRSIFDRAFADFRRFDITTRMFVIAAEVCGLGDRVTAADRSRTAVVLASSTGCLAADLRFERSLHVAKGLEPRVFPYTLPSTCLGVIAIRHRFRGPTLCLSVPEGGEGEGLEAAALLITGGEATAALVCLGDWLPPEAARPGKTRATALLMQPGHPDTSPTEYVAKFSDLIDAPLDAIQRILPGRRLL